MLGVKPHSGQFKKGHPYIGPDKSTLTFRKGHMRGAAARTWRPIGTVVVKKKLGTQLRMIKVRDVPGLRTMSNWMIYARYMWEREYGGIPAGQCVIHLDGDNLNDNITNLALMTRVEGIRYYQLRFPKKHDAARRKMSLTHTGMKHVYRTWVWECNGCSTHYKYTQRANKKPPRVCEKCGFTSFIKTCLGLKTEVPSA